MSFVDEPMDARGAEKVSKAACSTDRLGWAGLVQGVVVVEVEVVSICACAVRLSVCRSRTAPLCMCEKHGRSMQEEVTVLRRRRGNARQRGSLQQTEDPRDADQRRHMQKGEDEGRRSGQAGRPRGDRGEVAFV